MTRARGPARRRAPLDAPEFEAEIVDLAEDGRGLARIDGKVAFVADALPGERVRARLLRRRRGHDEAATLVVERASPDRIAPRCAHFGVCGGCVLQHLVPAAQIAFKQKQLLDALARIGGVRPDEVAAPVTGPVWGYRRRARLGVKYVDKKGGMLVGFREREAPLLARLERCEVLDARVGERLRELAEMLGRLSIRDRIPQIEVAAADHVALVLRVLAEPTAGDLATLEAFQTDSGFEFYLQRGGPGSVVPLRPPARPLQYSPDGGALRLRFEPTDFVQVNGVLSQALLGQALDWLQPRPGLRVLELFAGLGNFSLPLAGAGAQVTAVEGEAGLVERARANAAANGLQIEFLRADLFGTDPQVPWLRREYDAVLLDPPRAGAREILPAVAKIAPQRVVYVSCHPGTLARDAGFLVGEAGYRLRRAGVADMFPHTAHVESMALFERAR